jgi:ribosomal-protein-alanine N-acetyltransferase
MATPDLAAVMALEARAFEQGWPPTAFERELTHNAMARYLVLEGAAPAGPAGFAGLWLMVDQAHIVTVAVDPALRRMGYGRLLVHGLVAWAHALGMESATLECRASNEAARGLYGQYGFYEVGLRKRYYADNNEDAVIMTTEELASPAYRERFGRLEHWLLARFPAESLFQPGGGSPPGLQATVS